MEKERIEKVLGTTITKDDMKYLRTYYLKFYNDPEAYKDSGMISAMLGDLLANRGSNMPTTTEETQFIKMSGDVDVTGMPYPDHIRHQDRCEFNERNLLWHAFDEHEWRLGCKIANISIEWFLNTVRSVYATQGMLPNENNLNRFRSYWMQAAEGYAKLGLLEDYQAYRDCMLEMFQRYDEGADKWDLNTSIKWKTLVYEEFLKDVFAQVKYSDKITWDEEQTFERVKKRTGLSGIEFDEYYGTFEASVRCAKDDLAYLDMFKDDKRELSIDDVRGLFDNTFQEEIKNSIHYNWRVMLDALSRGESMTFDDIRIMVLKNAAEEIQKEKDSRVLYKDEVEREVQAIESLVYKIDEWFNDKPYFVYKAGGRIKNVNWSFDAVYNYAENRLSKLDLFSEYLISMHTVMRRFFYNPADEFIDKYRTIIYRIKDEAMTYADELRKIAIDRVKPNAGISALLKMAEG